MAWVGEVLVSLSNVARRRGGNEKWNRHLCAALTIPPSLPPSGPGCSSLLGMLFECGPFRLPNPHAHNHPKKDGRAGGRARRRLMEDEEEEAAEAGAASAFTSAAMGEGGREGGKEGGGDIPTLLPNLHGWNKAQHLLFVEQPVESTYHTLDLGVSSLPPSLPPFLEKQDCVRECLFGAV